MWSQGQFGPLSSKAYLSGRPTKLTSSLKRHGVLTVCGEAIFGHLVREVDENANPEPLGSLPLS